MKKTAIGVLLLLALAMTGCVTTGGASAWKCDAPGLVDASYRGGDTAYIHLQGFAHGGDYWVQLNEQRTEAIGTTANGTPFTCTKE